ncbi:MAG: tripartite tricarboxylate transporter substrate binding protein [Proteobacteria bacterium]|nr:tripartite tricarboxylate transporter substrate binding protein [Burkholderiales bacterium]
MKIRSLIIAAMSFGLYTTPVGAQKYPEKPIRIVVPFAPGGGADIFGRLIAQRLSETLGQTLVENRPGAGSTVGIEFVARAAPDGYTLLLSSAAFSASAALYPKLGYEPLRDFAPISVVTTVPLVIVTHPALPVKTVIELVKLARAKPGELLYSTAGPGSLIHLAGESFMAVTGTKLTQVPYKGGGQAMTGVLTGETQVMFATIETVMGQIRAGKLRAVAMTTVGRSPALPAVPTVAEQGLSGYEAQGWFALFAPAGTSTDIVNRVQGEVARAMTVAEVRERFLAEGAVPVGGTPAQLDKLVRSEIAQWARIVKQAGIKVD